MSDILEREQEQEIKPVNKGGRPKKATQAVHVQSRSPEMNKDSFVLDKKNRHYVLVEESSSDRQDLLYEMMCEVSPIASPGQSLYMDHAFVRGYCKNARVHLLSCDIRDFNYLSNMAAKSSHDLAFGSADVAGTTDGRIRENAMMPERKAPKKLSELTVEQEKDPITGY